MKKTRAAAGRNMVGPRIRELRLAAVPPVSQEDLSGRLAALGVSLDQAAISRIENQTRYVMDYEAAALAKALHVSTALIFQPQGLAGAKAGRGGST